jgi:signal transduction histidine kinase
MLDTKRNLIRFLSHEIRSPLNAINMGLSIIKKEIDNNKYNSNINDDFNNDMLIVVDEIGKACNTSLDILNDLLTYEKIDAGILLLDLQTVSAFPVIYSSLQSFVLQVCIYMYKLI